MYLGVERSPSSRCAEDVVAPEQPSGIGSKKRKAVDTFWKDSEFSRTEVEAAIHIAIQEIKASESGQFRIAEDAKRCLAVALDVFLRTTEEVKPRNGMISCWLNCCQMKQLFKTALRRLTWKVALCESAAGAHKPSV